MHNAFHISPIKGLPKPMQGGKWEIVNEFRGKSHRDGGIDILVEGGEVRQIHAPNEKPDVIAKNGRVWKDIGAAAYGVGEGLLDTVTLGATDPLTDAGYKALQKAGGSTEQEMREQNSLRGYGTTAGAVGGGFLTGGLTTGSAISQGAKGLGAGVGEGSPDSKFAQAFGTYVPLAGAITGLAVGDVGYASKLSALKQGADAAKAAGDVAKATEMANKAAQLGKLSKIATTAGKIGKFNPLIQAGASALGAMGKQQPLNLGPTQEAIRGLTPYATPGMAQSYKQLSQEIAGEASPRRGGGMSMMDGEGIGGYEGSGPIQFQQQPVYASDAYNYLKNYGINA